MLPRHTKMFGYRSRLTQGIAVELVCALCTDSCYSGKVSNWRTFRLLTPLGGGEVFDFVTSGEPSLAQKVVTD
jgi:hypothetical protein